MHVKSPAAHGVRSAITARNHLVESQVRLDNMIRGLCATFDFKPGPGQGKAFIDRVVEVANIPGLGRSITALLAVSTGLVKQITEMDRALREFAHRSQPCRQLLSIPGVGVQTSTAFAAAIDEVGRVRQSRTAGVRRLLRARRQT